MIKFPPPFNWEDRDDLSKDACNLGHSLRFTLLDGYNDKCTHAEVIRKFDPNHVFHGYNQGGYVRICRHQMGVNDTYHWAIHTLDKIKVVTQKRTLIVIRK